MIGAIEAIERLRAGNRRFAASSAATGTETSRTRRAELVARQSPFAIVLGCSDSRVPAELVFDQGLGDLFVIRVAGNIAARSQIGSVEFAADQFGTRLVVVLGHTHCGAIQATLQELQQPAEKRSPNLAAIVDRIRPGIEPLLGTEVASDPESLIREGVRANVRASAGILREASPLLHGLIENDGLVIASAEYDLATGLVDFFDLPS